MELEQIIKNTFVRSWQDQNEQRSMQGKKPLFYDTQTEKFCELVENKGGGELIVSEIDSPTQKYFASSETVLELDRFLTMFRTNSRKNREKSNGNHAEIMPKSFSNHAEIIANTGKVRKPINLASGINQAENMQLSFSYQKRINSAIDTVLKNTSGRNSTLHSQVERLQNMAEIAFVGKDVESQKEIYKKLKKKINQQTGARKASKYKRPPTDYKIILKENKEVVRLLKSQKFLKNSSNGFYKTFKALPKNMPGELVSAVNNRYLTMTNGESYSIHTLTDVANAIRKHEKINQGKTSKALIVVLIAILLLSVYVAYRFYFKAQINTYIPVNTEIAIPEKMLKDYVQIYENKARIKLTEYRKNLIINTIKSKANISEIDYLIDSIARQQPK